MFAHLWMILQPYNCLQTATVYWNMDGQGVVCIKYGIAPEYTAHSFDSFFLSHLGFLCL